MGSTLLERVDAALATVNDPEIKRPITEAGMVDSVEVDDAGVAPDGAADGGRLPMKDTTINRDVTAAVGAVDSITGVDLSLGVMSAEAAPPACRRSCAAARQREIPFAQPGSLTKGLRDRQRGRCRQVVGHRQPRPSMAAQGLKVGVVDADIYGHSVPAMLGVADQRPAQVEDLIMPVPTRRCPSSRSGC